MKTNLCPWHWISFWKRVAVMADKSHCALPEQIAFPFELPPAVSCPDFWSLPCGFPGGSDSKESACSAGDLGLIRGLGRSPGEGNGYPLQNSCLENSMDRWSWQAIVHGVAKSQTWLGDYLLLQMVRSWLYHCLTQIVVLSSWKFLYCHSLFPSALSRYSWQI